MRRFVAPLIAAAFLPASLVAQTAEPGAAQASTKSSVPRASDGKPDLTGVWQAGSTARGSWEEANSGTGLGGTGKNPSAPAVLSASDRPATAEKAKPARPATRAPDNTEMTTSGCGPVPVSHPAAVVAAMASVQNSTARLSAMTFVAEASAECRLPLPSAAEAAPTTHNDKRARPLTRRATFIVCLLSSIRQWGVRLRGSEATRGWPAFEPMKARNGHSRRRRSPRYSATAWPEPPNSAGKSFSLGSPSRMRSTVSA